MEIDKVFIINLKERTDRREAIEKELMRVDIKNYEFFDAIRPTTDDLNNWNSLFIKDIPTWFKRLNKDESKYRLGALGCLLSHYKIMQISKERGYKNVMILEDDTKFILKWFIPVSKLLENQLNKLKFHPKDIQKVKNLVCIEEWENISLINSPLEYDDDNFDPLKVKINVIDKFDSHIESFIDDKELDNVIVGISYGGNDVYLDQGDGDGANYSVSCKKFDT